MISNKTTFFAAALIFFNIQNSMCADAPMLPGHTSVDWFYEVRTNLNSAAIVTGIAATWHAFCYGLLPAGKAGVDYVFGKIDEQTATKELKKAGRKFTTSLFLAGLALAIEGVNKTYFRSKYYEKVAQLAARKS